MDNINCRCKNGCQCPPPDDLERRTREGRLSLPEAVARLHGRHCHYIERHGLRLRLSDAPPFTLVTEDGRSPKLRVEDYLASNWHIIKRHQE